MNDDPGLATDDPCDAWGPAGYRRDLAATQFAHDLEALIIDASDRGLTDKDILAKVLHAADELRGGAVTKAHGQTAG
jgi:hypothetical protein